ncbi:Arginine--pyruvate transaminase AruH [Roseivivax jejudonensis]|uniref:Arginine--pyruvate transaminase AruH n=1 Tax=Roseivivax jejudonensis TaxID=1529041 RepID=A0A1X6ZWH6_9RHOB|nr:pyridoxal phosphate-dependent aminotransferase [Roseivivax jejudonensis]SLN63161.1 Arginine--pyruvate transaminase AruH [Roseivivax jejudonensis]
MKVRIHKLFDYLLDTVAEEPDAIVGFSLSTSPTLGDFLPDLDPDLSLDWNQRSFRGLPELRAHILRQAGLDTVCADDDVLVTAGAAEANYLVLRQLLSPGDRLVTEVPGWPQAEVLGRAAEAEVVTVARDEADGWRLPLDRLEAAAVPGTKVIFLSNPNNPTGRVMDETELCAVVDIARRAGAWLVIDEVYAGLEWDGPRAPSVAGLYDKGITTGSVSKALGLQGLRTGWLICRDPELVMDAVILRENASEIMNILGEVVAEVALRPGRYRAALEAARDEGRAGLDRMDTFVTETPGLSWVRPQAGLIGLARLPDGIDGEDFARRLLAPPWKTFLLPGAAYGQPGHIRLGVGGGEGTNLETGLARLAECLATWPEHERAGTG